MLDYFSPLSDQWIYWYYSVIAHAQRGKVIVVNTKIAIIITKFGEHCDCYYNDYLIVIVMKQKLFKIYTTEMCACM